MLLVETFFLVVCTSTGIVSLSDSVCWDLLDSPLNIIYEIFHLKIIVFPFHDTTEIFWKTQLAFSHQPGDRANYSKPFRLPFENNATWKACYVCEIYAIWIQMKDFFLSSPFSTIVFKGKNCWRLPAKGVQNELTMCHKFSHIVQQNEANVTWIFRKANGGK